MRRFKRTTKPLAMILTLALMLTMLPVSTVVAAQAEQPIIRTAALDLTKEVTYIGLDGQTHTKNPSTSAITDCAEGWSWDHSSKTLTLSGANIRDENMTGEAIGILLPDDTILKLTKGTQNMVRGGDCNDRASYGIYCAGDLTVSGEGTLFAIGGTVQRVDSSYGIYTTGGGVTIKGGTVMATGGMAKDSSSGIYSTGGAVKVEGGTVIAAGGFADVDSCGIRAENGKIAINGGMVNVTGGTAGIANNSVQGNSCGMMSKTVTIDGGIVVAEGETVTDSGIEGVSCGIYTVTGGGVTIGGGKVTATGGGNVVLKMDVDSYGIFAAGTDDNSIIITGSGLLMAKGVTQAMNKKAGNDSFGAMTTDSAFRALFAVYGDNNAYRVTTGALDFVTDPQNRGVLSSDGYEWDNRSNKLTLNNLVLVPTKAGISGSGIRLPSNAEIVLQGVNVVYAGNPETWHNIAINSIGDLTVSGSGELFASTASARNSGTSLCYGVMAENGKLKVNGGTLIVGARAAGNYSYGIKAKDTEITGGLVVASAGDGVRTYGLHSADRMEIAGGTLIAKGGGIIRKAQNSFGSYGIRGQTMNITGGTVIGIAGTSISSGPTFNNQGIHSKNITMKDGTLIGVGGTTASLATQSTTINTMKTMYSYGISVDENTKVQGGMMVAIGGTAASSGNNNGHSIGCAPKLLNIDGGNMIAVGGTALGEATDKYIDLNRSSGIYRELQAATLQMRGGSITAAGGYAKQNGGDGPGESYGISLGTHGIDINGGTVTAVGETSAVPQNPILGTDYAMPKILAGTALDSRAAGAYNENEVSSYKYLRMVYPPRPHRIRRRGTLLLSPKLLSPPVRAGL